MTEAEPKQHPFRLVLLWAIRVLTGFLVFTALLPLIPSGHWVVRSCDFPRLQFLVLGVVPLVLSLWVIAKPAHRREGRIILTASLLVVLWQGWHVLRYTPVWAHSLETGDEHNLRLIVANIDFKNPVKDTSAFELAQQGADAMLLIEIDQAWFDALQDVRAIFPYRIEEIRDEGLGIAFWSRLPFREGEVRFLVSEERPSIHATLITPDDNPIRFIGLHPTPPGLERPDEEGRHHSRIRDAELILTADMVAEDPSSVWIVAGDFNDVAWSHTTRLFETISGLRDPRIGRGLYSTYHAEYPLLRYPIDHIYLSPGTRIKSLSRFPIPGSDHFAMAASIDTRGAYRTQPEAEPEDKTEAQELIREGEEDAEELGEAVDQPGTPDRSGPDRAASKRTRAE